LKYLDAFLFLLFVIEQFLLHIAFFWRPAQEQTSAFQQGLALELDQLLSSNQELLTPLLYWMPLNLPDSFSQALSYPVKILKLNSPKPVI
jgi:hypothetical protein